MSNELSQDDIDKMFSDSSKSNNADEEKDMQISEQFNTFAQLLESSTEEVFNTALSSKVVVKLTRVGIGDKNSIDFAEKDITVEAKLSVDSKEENFLIFINRSFASILADMMLMGSGEAKEELTEDDIDALKELISQLFGNITAKTKESLSQQVSLKVENIQSKQNELPDGDFYDIILDIAIPNVKSDSILALIEKNAFDNLFSEKEQENIENEDNEDAELEEKDAEEVPFKNVESVEQNSPTDHKENNLDLILDIDLDITLRIGQKEMLIKDILNLKENSVIELDKDVDEPMELLANGKTIAKGSVVVVDGHFGIKITHIETKEERIKSLGR